MDLDAPDLMAEVIERFHRRHEELYTYSVRDQEVVLVNARVAVIGELPALPEEPELAPRPAALPRERRCIYLAAGAAGSHPRLGGARAGADDQGPGDR